MAHCHRAPGQASEAYADHVNDVVRGADSVDKEVLLRLKVGAEMLAWNTSKLTSGARSFADMYLPYSTLMTWWLCLLYQQLHQNRSARTPGRTLIVTKAEVFAVKDGKETLCALMQQTIMVMHGKSEK